MKSPDFQALMRQLTNDQTPRVWSLLVTVFGELAQDEGAQIKSTLLSKLAPLLGIKPEAMRVALHRLRKDGWIKSERHGRTSTYSLTEWGRSQSASATPRIYNLEPAPKQAWIVVFDPGQSVRDLDIQGTWVASNILIATTPLKFDQAYISPISSDQVLPQWMIDRIYPAENVAMTKGFLDRLGHLQEAVQRIETLDCFEISAMRILIVDGWRRIALRTPQLPSYVFPKEWLGEPCRDCVASLLATYKKQSIDTLEQALSATV